MQAQDKVHPRRAYTQGSYKAEFQDACHKIVKAVKDYQPNRLNQYDQVSVLGLYWENDNIGIKPLTATLLNDVFAKVYNFKTEIFEIPTTSNGVALNNSSINGLFGAKFTSWLYQNHGPKNLIILYYSGHAEASQKVSGGQTLNTFEWSGDQGPQHIDWWSGFHKLLANAIGDKLLILDCCNAASAMIDSGGAVEVLAASGFESVASSSLTFSFTSHLIDLLKRYKGNAVTTAALCAEMIDQALVTNLEATPWHGTAHDKPAITLKAPASKQTVISHEMQPKSIGKVLISVSLTGLDTLPDCNRFVKWLTTNVPKSVAEINVEGLFKSGSSECLLTVPIALWLMLPEKDCFTFVNHVRSSNILLEDKSSTRPGQSSSENRPLALLPKKGGPGGSGGGVGQATAGNVPR